MKETTFDTEKRKHIVLLPGLIAPVRSLFPLVRYLRAHQEEYAVTAVPLRMSIESYERIVRRAEKYITKNLLEKSRHERIVLFGHSHGGRVACELVRRLKSAFPDTEYWVITAGSPMGKKLDYLSWLHKTFFNISKAYRQWPRIAQPNPSVAARYIGYYSDSDQTVTPEAATADYTGELIELRGFSHHDLISPSKIGPLLLGSLENSTQIA